MVLDDLVQRKLHLVHLRRTVIRADHLQRNPSADQASATRRQYVQRNWATADEAHIARELLLIGYGDIWVGVQIKAVADDERNFEFIVESPFAIDNELDFVLDFAEFAVERAGQIRLKEVSEFVVGGATGNLMAGTCVTRVGYWSEIQFSVGSGP